MWLTPYQPDLFTNKFRHSITDWMLDTYEENWNENLIRNEVGRSLFNYDIRIDGSDTIMILPMIFRMFESGAMEFEMWPNEGDYGWDLYEQSAYRKAYERIIIDGNFDNHLNILRERLTKSTFNIPDSLMEDIMSRIEKKVNESVSIE